MVPSYKCTQPEFQVLECSSDCDRDCEFSAWTIWSQCDKTCGVSIATRYRRIIKQPIGIGKQCPNEIEQTMPCDYIPCVKWKAANWFPCVPYYGSCGWGVQFWDSSKFNLKIDFHAFYANPCKSRNFSCLADNRLAQRNLCENNIGLIDDQFMLEDRERSCRIPCRGEYLNIDWTDWSLCQPINCRSEAMVRSAKRYRHTISFLPEKTFLEPKIEIQQRDCVTWSCFSYKQNRSGCFR